VECKDDTDWIKCYTKMIVEGTKPTGRPRKPWWDGIREDMKTFGRPGRMYSLGEMEMGTSS